MQSCSKNVYHVAYHYYLLIFWFEYYYSEYTILYAGVGKYYYNMTAVHVYRKWRILYRNTVPLSRENSKTPYYINIMRWIKKNFKTRKIRIKRWKRISASI